MKITCPNCSAPKLIPPWIQDGDHRSPCWRCWGIVKYRIKDGKLWDPPRISNIVYKGSGKAGGS